MLATAQPRRDTALRLTFVLALLAFLLLSALDIATTAFMLTRGVQEGSPLIRTLIGDGGMGAFAAVKLTSTAAALLLFLATFLVLPGRWRWLSVGAIVACDLWLFVVAGHNLLLVLSAAGVPL